MSDDEPYVSSDGSASDSEAEETSDTQPSSKTGTEPDPMLDSRSLQHYLLQEKHTDAAADSLRMTKYEYARIKGERLQQLYSGAIPCVPYTDADTSETLFQREFKSGKLPFLVQRKTPDSKYAFIKIRQFTNRGSNMFD